MKKMVGIFIVTSVVDTKQIYIQRFSNGAIPTHVVTILDGRDECFMTLTKRNTAGTSHRL